MSYSVFHSDFRKQFPEKAQRQNFKINNNKALRWKAIYNTEFLNSSFIE